MSEHEINDRSERTTATGSNLTESAITNPENQSSYFAARPTATGSESLPGLEIGRPSGGTDSQTENPSPTAPETDSTSKGRTIRSGPDGPTSDGGKHELNTSTAPVPPDLVPGSESTNRSNDSASERERLLGGQTRLPRNENPNMPDTRPRNKDLVDDVRRVLNGEILPRN